MRRVGQVRRGKWPIMALAESIAIFASIQSWIRQENGWPRSLQAMCKCRLPLAVLGMHRCCCRRRRRRCKLQNCRCDGWFYVSRDVPDGLHSCLPLIFIHACFAFISG